MDEDFEAIRGLLGGAGLAEEGRHTALWCLGQLPGLYGDFCRTCDTRTGEEIRRLVRGMLRAMADAPEAAEAVAGRLQAMHERLGIPGPDLTPPAAKKPRRRKAG